MTARDKIKMFLFVPLLFANCSCAQNSNKGCANITAVLNETYDKDYKTFFEYFPGDFKTFIDIYGYTEYDNGKFESGSLYSVYVEHIAYLMEHRKEIPFEMFFNKVFNISQNSYWEADAYSDLVYNLRKMFETDCNDINQYLSKKTDDELFQFWYFIFNGPHHEPAAYKKEISVINNCFDKRQTDIIDKIWVKIEEEWRDE